MLHKDIWTFVCFELILSSSKFEKTCEVMAVVKHSFYLKTTLEEDSNKMFYKSSQIKLTN